MPTTQVAKVLIAAAGLFVAAVVVYVLGKEAWKRYEAHSVVSVVNLAIWLTVGFAWWKVLGFW